MTAPDTRRRIPAILDAFFERLQSVGAVDTETVVRREPVEGERIEGTNTALVALFRGAMQGEPVAAMSEAGTTWECTWVARIALTVNGADAGDDRVRRLDDLAESINGLCPPGDTLDGLVDLVEVQAMAEPNPELLGAALGVVDAEIPVLFLYTAPTAAG